VAHARLIGLLAAAALAAAGCARAATESLPVHQAWQAAVGQGEALPAARATEGFGYQAPYVPLVIPPDVRRVWVPTHVNEEGELIQGHWVFLRLTDWRWFTAAPREAQALGLPVEDRPLPPPWPAPGEAPATRLIPWRLDAGSQGRAPEPAPQSQAPAAPAPQAAQPGARPEGAR
jgi:hypothetical protein